MFLNGQQSPKQQELRLTVSLTSALIDAPDLLSAIEPQTTFGWDHAGVPQNEQTFALPEVSEIHAT